MGKTVTKPLPKSSEVGVKRYLFLYNILQFSGWSFLFYQVIKHYASGGTTSNLWGAVGPAVVVFQNAAILEIVHVAIGFVRSDLTMTTAQVFSRVMMVCGALMACPTAKESFGFPLLLCAWCPTEIIRYLFYALSLNNSVPRLLLWTRYTFFYFLYPMGVTGELLCLYATQQYVKETNMWSVALPNAWNFAFSYRYLLMGIMGLYIPFFPQLYFYMIAQRKKVLGGGATKTEKQVS